MKNHIIDIIKDITISILVVILIIIIVSLIFYDKIAFTKVIPEVEEFSLSEEMEEEIEETNLEEAEEVIINYHIDAVDIKKYEKNNEYVKGKSNPFAENSDYIEEDSSEEDTDKGFFEDEGIK